MEGLCEYNITLGESRIHVKSDSKHAIMMAIETIKLHRHELVQYIRRHSFFLHALEPIETTSDVPTIIQNMIASSQTANVGPMACVAGALADMGIETMRKCDAKVALIENGGEISAFTDRPLYVSILSSDSPLSGKIGFCLTPDDCPIGIATSSATSGHAISFGEADSATVIASNASLADAAATAVCNAVVGEDVQASIQLGLKMAESIKGVRGALIVRGEHAGLTGRLPKLVRVSEAQFDVLQSRKF